MEPQEQKDSESGSEKRHARFGDGDGDGDLSSFLKEEDHDYPHAGDSSWRAKNVLSSSMSPEDGGDDDDIALFGLDGMDGNGAVDPDEVDSLLAREMSGLSMADREKAYYDVHGVSEEIQETPEMIAESIDLLRQELMKGEQGMSAASADDEKAYNKAMAMDSSYVQDPKFLIRFLRADLFNIPAAAVRVKRFFGVKMDLFGPDLLVKDITQDDLGDDTMYTLYNGGAHCLPFRDRGGRVTVLHFAHPDSLPVQAIMRKTFYVGMVLYEDEETQKKGHVIVAYQLGHTLTWQQTAHEQDLNRQRGRLLVSLPCRPVALHVCVDSMILWRPILAVFKYVANTFTRVRIREHTGTHKEVQFSLQTFGISMVGFPVTEDGEVLPHYCQERWKKRRALEQRMKNKGEGHARDDSTGVRVETPSKYDVLLGRGRSCYSHVGNLRLRKMVSDKFHLYEISGFGEKLPISDEIVCTIKSLSGRFLKDDGAGWVEVDDETARKKVSHAFRTFRGLQNAQEKSKGTKRRSGDKEPGPV